MFKFEELHVYKESIILAEGIYDLSEKWPNHELFSLTSQLRRAAISISLNIAEGSSRTKKDFSHFLSLARGSCFECVAILTIARKRNYIADKEYINLYQTCEKFAKMLSKLKSSIK